MLNGSAAKESADSARDKGDVGSIPESARQVAAHSSILA